MEAPHAGVAVSAAAATQRGSSGEDPSSPKRPRITLYPGMAGTITCPSDRDSSQQVTVCDDCGFFNHAWGNCERNKSAANFNSSAVRWIGTWRTNTAPYLTRLPHPHLHRELEVLESRNANSSATPPSRPPPVVITKEEAAAPSRKVGLRMIRVNIETQHAPPFGLPHAPATFLSDERVQLFALGPAATVNSASESFVQFHHPSHSSLRMAVQLNGVTHRHALIDTGASRTVISVAAFHKSSQHGRTPLQLVDTDTISITPAVGDATPALGCSDIPVTILSDGEKKIKYTKSMECIVVQGLKDEVILGLDFIRLFFTHFNIGNSTGIIHQNLIPDYDDEQVGVGVAVIAQTYNVKAHSTISIPLLIKGTHLCSNVKSDKCTIAVFAEPLSNKRGRPLDIKFTDFVTSISVDEKAREPVLVRIENNSNLPIQLQQGRLIGLVKLQTEQLMSLSRVVDPRVQSDLLSQTSSCEQVENEIQRLQWLVQRMDVEEIKSLTKTSVGQAALQSVTLESIATLSSSSSSSSASTASSAMQQ